MPDMEGPDPVRITGTGGVVASLVASGHGAGHEGLANVPVLHLPSGAAAITTAAGGAAPGGTISGAKTGSGPGAAAGAASGGSGAPGQATAGRVCDVRDIAFARGVNDRFVTCGTDNAVRVWDALSQACIHACFASGGGHPTCVAFGGDFLVSGWQDGAIRAYLAEPAAGAGAVSEGGSSLAALSTGREGGEAGYGSSRSLARGPEGVAASMGGVAGAFGGGAAADGGSGGPGSGSSRGRGGGRGGGRALGVAGTTDDPNLIWIIPEAHASRDGGVTDVEIAYNQRFIVTAGGSGSIRLWDIRSRSLLSQFAEHAGAVTGIKLLPGDQQLLSVGRDRWLMAWDLRAGKRKAAHLQRLGGFHAVDVSCDGGTVLTAGQDRKIHLWRLTDSAPYLSIPVPAARATAAAAAAAGGAGGSAAALAAASSSSSSREAGADGQANEVTTIAAANGRPIFATGDLGSSVRLWDVTTGRQLCECLGHSGIVRKVAFSPDDKQLVSVGTDGSVLVWNIFV